MCACFLAVTVGSQIHRRMPSGLDRTSWDLSPHPPSLLIQRASFPSSHLSIHLSSHPSIAPPPTAPSPLVLCPGYMWCGHYQHVFVRAVHLNESQWTRHDKRLRKTSVGTSVARSLELQKRCMRVLGEWWRGKREANLLEYLQDGVITACACMLLPCMCLPV